MERPRPSWALLLALSATGLVGSALFVAAGLLLVQNEWRSGQLLLASAGALVSLFGVILIPLNRKAARRRRLLLIVTIIAAIFSLNALVLAFSVPPAHS